MLRLVRSVAVVRKLQQQLGDPAFESILGRNASGIAQALCFLREGQGAEEEFAR